MYYFRLLKIIFIFMVIFTGLSQTIGLTYINETQVAEGYVLFAPNSYTRTYLIDIYGNMVHYWDSEYCPGQSCYLLEDGRILRTALNERTHPTFDAGGRGGRLQIIDWDNNLLWDYQFSDSNTCQHHDCEYLPGGTILFISWERISEEEALQAGRAPEMLLAGEVWSEMILEVRPTGDTSGEIVWRWRAWDHLVQEYDETKENYGSVYDNPGKINLNYVDNPAFADWLHVNAVDYNPELDQIAISSHEFSEFWIIDHSTVNYDNPGLGITEAEGEAGDILYRWGNPAAMNRGDRRNQKLFAQHDIQWIPEDLPDGGNFLVFNNGLLRIPPPNYSTVEIIENIVLPDGSYPAPTSTGYLPEEQLWIYTATPPTSFYSSHISGAGRLEGGNTIICEGETGRLFEINTENEIVWEYVNPVNSDGPGYQGTIPEQNGSFRCYKYPSDYPAFDGRTLEPSGPIELYENICENMETRTIDCNISPNPARNFAQIETSEYSDLYIIDINGRASKLSRNKQNHIINLTGFSPGIYLVRAITENNTFEKKLLIIK